MGVVALDAMKLTAMMVSGGVFAIAGLWLMFRPQQAGEAAKAELFGLKFQASSAGLVVFVIGAAFLALPIIVPEKPQPLRAAVASGGAGREAAPRRFRLSCPRAGPRSSRTITRAAPT